MAGQASSLRLPAQTEGGVWWKMTRASLRCVTRTRDVVCRVRACTATLLPSAFRDGAGHAGPRGSSQRLSDRPAVHSRSHPSPPESSQLLHGCRRPRWKPAPGAGTPRPRRAPRSSAAGRATRPNPRGRGPSGPSRVPARSRPRGGRSAARASRAALTHHLDPADGARIALHVPAPHGHRVPLLEREHLVASRLGACAPGVRGQGAGLLAVFHVGHGGSAEPAAETLGRGRPAAMAARRGRPTGHSAARRPSATAAPEPGAARDWLAPARDVAVRQRPAAVPRPLHVLGQPGGPRARGRQRAEVRPPPSRVTVLVAGAVCGNHVPCVMPS